MSSTCRVAPFGNLRITGYVHLLATYRSLSRPSSPLRAKASSVCPYLLSSYLVLSNISYITNHKIVIIYYYIESRQFYIYKLNTDIYYQYSLFFIHYVKDLFLVENTGVEPVTSCVQGKRSSQLS